MEEEEDALPSAPSLSSGCLAPRGSRVLARGLRQGTHRLPALPAVALCCAALVAAEKTQAQAKKGSLARRKGARRAPKATTVSSGDKEVALRHILRRWHMESGSSRHLLVLQST